MSKLRSLPALFLRAWQEKKDRVLRWFWLLLGYFLSQVFIQALNFLGGIIIIRSLSKDDYADYTIINTMGPVITMLSDNGITLGLFAVGRKIWQDDEKMGQLVHTGQGLRRSFGLVSALIVGPILAWMLARHHASWSMIIVLMIGVLAGNWCYLTSGVMRVVIELRQQIHVLRNAGLASALVRFSLIASFAYFFFIQSWLAVLATGCAAALEATLLVRAVKKQIHWQAPINPEYRTTIYSMVRKTAPLTIYFCLQSQVSIWLISIFGQTHQVADIGAVGRIGAIFTVLGSVYGAIVVPRFSRSNGRRHLLKRFWQIIGSYLLILFGITVVVKLFPAPLLFLLGPKYGGLGYLLWLVILSSGLGSFLALVGSLNTCKGWVAPAIISIPMEILTQIVLLLSFDLGKSQNVIIFSCISVLPPVILNIVYLLRMIHIEEKEEAHA